MSTKPTEQGAAPRPSKFYWLASTNRTTFEFEGDVALQVETILNAHDALVAALRLAQPLVHGYLQAMGGTHGDEILNQIDAALALTETEAGQ